MKLEENVRRVVRSTIMEGLSKRLYHFTSLKSLFRILHDDVMYCQASYAGGNSDNLGGGTPFYVSFTRNKSLGEGFGYAQSSYITARIEFDGNELSSRFKGGPVNYWGYFTGNNKYTYLRKAQGLSKEDEGIPYYYAYDGDSQYLQGKSVASFPKYVTKRSPERINYDGNNYVKKRILDGVDRVGFQGELQHHKDDEMEDRIFTDKSKITGIKKYIKRIDIYAPEKYISKVNEDILNILSYLSVSKLIHIYDNEKDFVMQSSNEVNERFHFGYAKPQYELDDSSVNCDLLGRFFSIATVGMSKEEGISYVSKNVRKYGLEKYLDEIMKSYRFGRISIDDENGIGRELQNSKQPTLLTSNVHQMICDIIRATGAKSVRDFYKIKKKCSDTEKNKVDYDKYANIKLFQNNYGTYDVTFDDDTDAWYMVYGTRSLRDRLNSVNEIMDDLNYYTYGELDKRVRGGDINRFKKYLQNLAHKGITIMGWVSLLKRLGLDDTDICNVLQNGRFQDVNQRGWSYNYHQVPFPTDEIGIEANYYKRHYIE